MKQECFSSMEKERPRLMTVFSEVTFLGFKPTRKDLKRLGRVMTSIYYKKHKRAAQTTTSIENGKEYEVRCYILAWRPIMHKQIKRFYARKKRNTMGENNTPVQG